MWPPLLSRLCASSPVRLRPYMHAQVQVYVQAFSSSWARHLDDILDLAVSHLAYGSLLVGAPAPITSVM